MVMRVWQIRKYNVKQEMKKKSSDMNKQIA